jgi:hypothetical protein
MRIFVSNFFAESFVFTLARNKKKQFSVRPVKSSKCSYNLYQCGNFCVKAIKKRDDEILKKTITGYFVVKHKLNCITFVQRHAE